MSCMVYYCPGQFHVKVYLISLCATWGGEGDRVKGQNRLLRRLKYKESMKVHRNRDTW